MAKELIMDDLTFYGGLDVDGEIPVSLETCMAYITKHDAKKIIQHLTDVFELEQE